MSKGRVLIFSLVLVFVPALVGAQDRLPYDNGLATYHTAPRYRDSESHPLRVLAYAVHPIGWVARELVFRPLSYFASSTEETRSVMGYREPFDFRQPECFSADSSIPDCRSIAPFNYGVDGTGRVVSEGERHVYFPDVNFDFDVRRLNDLGRGRAHQIAQLLQKSPGVRVVLEGHADYKGSDSYNERLGMDRAEALRQELIALGVPAESVSTVTFGKSKPILPEQEDWARAVNRRVEVRVDEVPMQ
ncbi:MAG: OmpA family protein [Deltaproteobacteria bacterium]|nr:OmpA family protein [Deltaproteobacteria bacterium]